MAGPDADNIMDIRLSKIILQYYSMRQKVIGGFKNAMFLPLVVTVPLP